MKKMFLINENKPDMMNFHLNIRMLDKKLSNILMANLF